MAHKVLVGGTEYDTVGGKTLVGGASYSIVNGKVLIDGTEYDIPFKVTDFANLWDGDDSEDVDIVDAAANCVKYANGYWMVGGTRHKNGIWYACIAYTADLRNWTIKDLWQGAGEKSNAATIKCIEYANGYWMVGGCMYNASDDNTYARFSYSTSPGGQWESLLLWSALSYQRIGNYDEHACINFIKEGGGTVIVCGLTDPGGSTYGHVKYASVDSFSNPGDWSDVSLSAIGLYRGPRDGITGIEYGNGYWCLSGVLLKNGTTEEGWEYTAYAGAIAYATDLSGAWTIKELIPINFGGPELAPASDTRITCVKYANGCWMFGGLEYPNHYDTSGEYYVDLLVCESLGGSTTTSFREMVVSTYAAPMPLSISYDNGYWAVVLNRTDYKSIYGGSCCLPMMLYRYGDTWTQLDMWEPGLIKCILYDNGYWFCGGSYDSFARVAWARKYVTNYEKLQLT